MACASTSDECPTAVTYRKREHVCAICLEQYTNPRGLSCLHTFCEGCIQSCILKEVEKGVQLSSIRCPVCLKDTEPVDPTKSPVEWVKDLKPVNALTPIVKTIDEREATVVLCDNCSGENQPTAVAVKHCRDCKHYLCKDCTSMHTRLKALAGHKLVPVEEASSEHPVGKDLCPVHTGERFKFYCEGHNVLCCSTCANFKHLPCETLVELIELGQGLKSDNRTENLQYMMTALQGSVKETKSTIISNRKDMDTQADAMVVKAGDLRDQLMTAMDRLVVMVTEDCRQVKKDNGIEGDDEISSLERLSAAILNSCSLLKSVITHGTESQIFIEFHKVEEQVKGYEELVNKDWSGLESRDLHMDLFHKVGDFVSFLNSISDVDVKKVSKKSGLVDITKCSVKHHSSTYVKTHPDMAKKHWYTGIVHLPDGRRVATDRRNTMCCLMDDACTVTAYIKLPGEPTNLEVIGPSEVVIPLSDTKQLQRVTVGPNSLTLNGTIPCQDREPMCVSRVSDTEVAVGWKEGLSIITLDGTEKMYLDKDSSDRKIQNTSESRIVVARKTASIIQCCTNTNKVYCFNFTGKVKFQYKGKLTEPSGPSLDRDGNVYICERTYDSKTVQQFSPTGELLSAISTTGCPYTTCFNPAGDELLVMHFNKSAPCYYATTELVTTTAQKVRFVPEQK